jgi:hypothetical protein
LALAGIALVAITRWRLSSRDLCRTGALLVASSLITHAEPVIKSPVTDPPQIITGQPTTLTVRAAVQVAPGDPSVQNVTLLRIDPSGTVLLGVMTESGSVPGERRYTMQINVTESGTELRLRTSVALQGILLRKQSQIAVIPVVQASSLVFTPMYSGVKLPRDESLPSGIEPHLKASRGEATTMQFGLTSIRTFSGLTPELTQFQSDTGALIDTNLVQLYLVKYTNIAPLMVLLPGSKAGEWPDGLCPIGLYPRWPGRSTQAERNCAPFALSPGQQNRQILWAEVRVPVTAVPGTYKAVLRVREAGTNTIAGELPITLTVWNFELPQVRSLATAVNVNTYPILLKHYDNAYLPGTWRHAKDLVKDFVSELREGGGLTAQATLAPVRHNATTGESAPGDWPEWLEVQSDVGRTSSAVPVPIKTLSGTREDSWCDPAMVPWSPEKLPLFTRFFQDVQPRYAGKPLPYAYLFDEPFNNWAPNPNNCRTSTDNPDMKRLRQIRLVSLQAEAVHNGAPSVRPLVTMDIGQARTLRPDPETRSKLQWPNGNNGQPMTAAELLAKAAPNYIFVVNTVHLGSSPADLAARYDDFRSRGSLVWWYSSCSVEPGQPNLFIDQPGSAVLSFGPLTWVYGLTGFLYYEAISTYAEDPVWSKNWTTDCGVPRAGDGSLLYRGDATTIGGPKEQGAPLPSIRLHLIRQSFNLYEYLKALESRGRSDLAEQIASSLVRSDKDYSSDVARYEEARELAANALR